MSFSLIYLLLSPRATVFSFRQVSRPQAQVAGQADDISDLHLLLQPLAPDQQLCGSLSPVLLIPLPSLQRSPSSWLPDGLGLPRAIHLRAPQTTYLPPALLPQAHDSKADHLLLAEPPIVLRPALQLLPLIRAGELHPIYLLLLLSFAWPPALLPLPS